MTDHDRLNRPAGPRPGDDWTEYDAEGGAVRYYDAPGFDIASDPTGRTPTVRIGSTSELAPDEARRLAATLVAAADYADGTIRCRECSATFPGTRKQARAKRWEPYSNRTQRLLDAGPMVCPDCIRDLLDRALDAARSHFADGRTSA